MCAVAWRRQVAHVAVTNPDECVSAVQSNFGSWHPPLARNIATPHYMQRHAATLFIRHVSILPAAAPLSHPPPFSGYDEEEDAEGEQQPLSKEEEEEEFRREGEREVACWHQKGLLDVLGMPLVSHVTAAADALRASVCGVADPERLVRLEAVRGLVALGSADKQGRRGEGENLVLNALRAAVRDPDCETRATALRGLAELAPRGDGSAIELLAAVVEDCMEDKYLSTTQVPRVSNEVVAFQEAAVQALPDHALHGRVRVLSSPSEACAAVLSQRLDEEHANSYMLAAHMRFLDLEIERLVKENEGRASEETDKLQQEKRACRLEKLAVEEAIRSLQASQGRVEARTVAARGKALGCNLWLTEQTHARSREIAVRFGAVDAQDAEQAEQQLAAETSTDDASIRGRDLLHVAVAEGAWHGSHGGDGAEEEAQASSVPACQLCVPEEACEHGAVSWTLRSFPELETLAPSSHMVCGGPAALAELTRLWARVSPGGRPYVPLLAECSTWHPPMQIGEGGSLAQGKVVEGELVHACLWAMPFILPPVAPVSADAAGPDDSGRGGGDRLGSEELVTTSEERSRQTARGGMLLDSGGVWDAIGRVGFQKHLGLRLFYSAYPPGTPGAIIEEEHARDPADRHLRSMARKSLKDKILVLRLPLHPPESDGELIGELLQEATRLQARAVLLVARENGPLPSMLPVSRATQV
jgi:hypothetical protein